MISRCRTIQHLCQRVRNGVFIIKEICKKALCTQFSFVFQNIVVKIFDKVYHFDKDVQTLQGQFKGSITYKK